MRLKLRYALVPILLGAIVIAAPGARATLVTESFQGVVAAASGDVNTVFGTTNGIIGRAVGITVSYDMAQFGVPGPGSNTIGHFWDSTDGSLPNGAVRMTQTINGVTLTYDGVYYDTVLVAYGCPGTTSCGPWDYSNWNQIYGAAAETQTPYGINAAQINLGAYDSALMMTNPALDPAGPFDFAETQVQSDGANWFTPTGDAQWTFQIDLPEPAGLAPVLLGAALLSQRLRRKPAGL